MLEKNRSIRRYPAGEKKINQEKKYKQYFNSRHSATACNHSLKWKLHLAQVHGYFMDYFCSWLYITHVVQQLLRGGNCCWRLRNWNFCNICFPECIPEYILMLVLCRCVFARINVERVSVQMVTCETDRSGITDSICMIGHYESAWASSGRIQCPFPWFFTLKKICLTLLLFP